MKNYNLLLILLFCITTSISAQEVLEDAKVKFDLPNEHWKFAEKIDNKNVIIYTYKRDYIVDSMGRKIDPQISFILEPVDSSISVIQYSTIKRVKVPFEVVTMFTHEDGMMKFENGIGYQGKYVDQGLEHRIYLVHGINNNMGITVVMDTTEELAHIVAPEFLKSLRSFDSYE